MENLQPAPWIVTEKDPTDRRFIMIHNCYTNRTFRLLKKLAGQPLGAGVSEEWKQFLLAEKLIVDPANVMPLIEERLRAIMYGFSANTARAVFVPTYSCQFACEYCYNVQARKPAGKKRLPPEDIAKRFLKYYTRTPAQFWTMIITGGGEPFLAADYIYKTMKHVVDGANDMGRDFNMTIVTNGETMTLPKVSKLVKVGFNKIQVTLDPRHDEKRPMAKGGGTLGTILENIAALPPEVAVNVSSNLYVGDEDDFKKLLERLDPLKKRIGSISTVIITGQVTGVAPAKQGKMSRLYGPKEVNTMIACLDAIEQAGFRGKATYPKVTCETFMISEHCFINFAGESPICPGVDNHPEYAAKDFYDAEARAKFDMRLANPQWKEFCFTDGVPCPYLVNCFGGCRLISVTQGMGWETINCEKYNFDRMTRRQLTGWAG